MHNPYAPNCNSMKAIQIVLASAVVAAVGCGTSNRCSTVYPGQFEMASNSNGNFVIFQKGRYSWNIDTNLLSMNVGSNYSVTFRLDKNDNLKSILLELRSTQGSRHFVSDMNADGIPEQRRLAASGETQVLIRGEFFTLIEDDMRRHILFDGKTNEVHFVNGVWMLKE